MLKGFILMNLGMGMISLNKITYKKQVVKWINIPHAGHGLEKPNNPLVKAWKSSKKPKAQKGPKPESLKMPRLWFWPENPTRKPTSLARPVPTIGEEPCEVVGRYSKKCRSKAVVYQAIIAFGNKTWNYIGMTSRSFHDRWLEHKNYMINDKRAGTAFSGKVR